MAKLKLTPERQDQIVSLIRAGNFKEVAAQAVGIGKSTFWRWLEFGEKEEEGGTYRDFWEAVKKAEAESEARKVMKITQIGEDNNWTALAWQLERSHPDRWGRYKEKVVVSVEHSLNPDSREFLRECYNAYGKNGAAIEIDGQVIDFDDGKNGSNGQDGPDETNGANGPGEGPE